MTDVSRFARVGVVAILLGTLALWSGSLGGTSKAAPLNPSQTLKTSGEPSGIAIDSQRERAYVTDSKENMLFVFNVTSGEAIAHVPTGRQPHQVVLLGERAFVSNFTDASITVIDTQANRALRTLAVGGLGLAVNRQTNRLYAAAGSRVFVLDATSETLIATLAAPAGANLWGVAVDVTTNRIYATDIASPRVLVFDGATNAFVAEVAIDAPSRFGIAVGPLGRVFVASYLQSNAQLSVIDGTAARVIARTPTDPLATTLVVDQGGTAYLTSAADRTVSALDPRTGRAPAKISPPDAPGAAAINPATGQLVVATPGGAAPPPRLLVDPIPLIKP